MEPDGRFNALPRGLSRFETAMIDQLEVLSDECGASFSVRSQIAEVIFLAIRKRVTRDIVKLEKVLNWCNAQLVAGKQGIDMSTQLSTKEIP